PTWAAARPKKPSSTRPESDRREERSSMFRTRSAHWMVRWSLAGATLTVAASAQEQPPTPQAPAPPPRLDEDDRGQVPLDPTPPGPAPSSQTAPGQEPSRQAPPGSPQLAPAGSPTIPDRKSTRLNSSHVKISYAVFCLEKKSCIHV